MKTIDSIVRQVQLGEMFKSANYHTLGQLAIRGFRDLQKAGGFAAKVDLKFDGTLYTAPAPDDMMSWIKVELCNERGRTCALSYNADLCVVEMKQEDLCQCGEDTETTTIASNCSSCGKYHGNWDFWNYQPKKGILGQRFSYGSQQRHSPQGMFKYNNSQRRFEFTKEITDTIKLTYTSNGLKGINAQSRVVPEHMIEVLIAWVKHRYMMDRDVPERKVERFKNNYVSRRDDYRKHSFKYSFEDLKRVIRSSDRVSVKG